MLVHQRVIQGVHPTPQQAVVLSPGTTWFSVNFYHRWRAALWLSGRMKPQQAVGWVSHQWYQWQFLDFWDAKRQNNLRSAPAKVCQHVATSVVLPSIVEVSASWPGFFWQVACTCWAFYPAVAWLGRGHSLCFRAEHHLIRNRFQIMIVVFMLWGPYLFATTIPVPPSFSVQFASRNSKRTFGLGRFSSSSHPTPNFQLSPNETGSLMNSLIKWGGSTLQRPESDCSSLPRAGYIWQFAIFTGQHPIFVCSNPVLHWQNPRPLFCSVDCFEGKSTGKNQESFKISICSLQRALGKR